MQLSVQPASAALSVDAIAELLWSTDPKLNAFMLQSRDVLRKVLKGEWPAHRGLLCHRQAFTATRNGHLLGVLIGHRADEYEQNFEAAMALQMVHLSPREREHLTFALTWMDRLFPTVRSDSYYILELSTKPAARGEGVASRLLNAATARAQEGGCTSICLDVAADNEAVSFYQHKGFIIEIETRVPWLEKAAQIGTHLHMRRELD